MVKGVNLKGKRQNAMEGGGKGVENPKNYTDPKPTIYIHVIDFSEACTDFGHFLLFA